MKYVDTLITFSEIPKEVALCINLSGCKIHCKGCLSRYLWEDIGTPLIPKTLDDLITNGIQFQKLAIFVNKNSRAGISSFMRMIRLIPAHV